MKIAIVGAHRVGKTTLAEELVERLLGYTLEAEPYFQLEASGYKFSEIPFAKRFLCSVTRHTYLALDLSVSFALSKRARQLSSGCPWL